MAAKKKVSEEVKETATKVADKAAAEKIEAKKTVRSAARQTKEKVTATKAKAEKKVAAKKEDAKEVKAAAAAEAKDAKTAKKIEATKKTRAAAQKVKDAVAPIAESVKKPVAKAKTGKVNLIFQSLLGGAVTPEEIAAKLPKEATDAYIKIEENTIYWVGKNGEMGAVEIWD